MPDLSFPESVSAPLILVPQYFGCTIFERQSSKYLPFDQETTDLWVRLKCEPFEAILNEAKEENKRDALWKFYEYFYRRGYFTYNHKFAGTILDIQPPADFLTGPLAVHLEITTACNLRCVHCFAGTPRDPQPPLTLGELDQLFASLARIGSFRLGLTGGEPLLRKDLFELIDLARLYGLHPCLTTNGLLITEDIAREFGKRDLVWLNVSLEGASAVTNDVIRGPGTFEEVMKRLKILAKHTPFSLAFTIMRSNLAEISDCAELAFQVGAHTAVFRPLYPVGSAQGRPELMPTFEEYSEALEKLADTAHVCCLNPFTPQLRQSRTSNILTHADCGAGNTVCSISVSGEVNPCGFLGPEFAAGNVRSQPFETIWNHSPVLKSIRESANDMFHTGCRARALTLNGSALAPDPWIAPRGTQRSSHESTDILEFFSFVGEN